MKSRGRKRQCPRCRCTLQRGEEHRCSDPFEIRPEERVALLAAVNAMRLARGNFLSVARRNFLSVARRIAERWEEQLPTPEAADD